MELRGAARALLARGGEDALRLARSLFGTQAAAAKAAQCADHVSDLFSRETSPSASATPTGSAENAGTGLPLDSARLRASLHAPEISETRRRSTGIVSFPGLREKRSNQP